MSFISRAKKFRKPAQEKSDELVSSARRDIALIAATGGAALLFSRREASAVPVPVSALPGKAGRDYIGNPFSVISVVDAQYGCIDDGQDGVFTVTYTTGTPNLKCVTAASAGLTVANNGPNGVATVTFGNPAGATYDGRGPMPSWVNKTIAITCPDTTIFTSRVADFTIDLVTSLQRLVLADAAPGNLATGSVVTTTYACPCFTQYYVGKTIYLTTGGQGAQTPNGSLTSSPGWYVPLSTTISSVTDAYNIVLGTNLTGPSSASLVPPQMHIRFGSNNTGSSTTGYVRAGLEAYRGRKEVWFPGLTKPQSTGIFYMFDYLPNSGSGFTQANHDASMAYANVRKFSDGATGEFMSATTAGSPVAQDLQLAARVVPFSDSMAAPSPLRGVFGSASLLRCSTKSVINATVIGDSWSVWTVDGQASQTPLRSFLKAFEDANPSKVINWDLRGVGGSTFFDIISGVNFPAAAENFPWSTGTHPYIYYAQNHSSGNTPDLVVVSNGGVNDSNNIHSNDILGVVNTIRAFPKYKGLPPDVICVAYGARWGQVITSGSEEFRGLADEYGCSMVASVCKAYSIPLIDIGTSLNYAESGWSRGKVKMKLMPNCPQGVVTSLVPYRIPYKCANYMLAVKLVGTGGADFWGRAGTLEFTLSAKDDNRVVVGLDASNNMTVQTQLWGKTVTTTLSLANGSAALTTSGQTAVNPNRGIFPNPSAYVISFGTGAFAGTQNQSMLFNGVGLVGAGGARDFRTFGAGATGGVAFVCDGNAQLTVCTSAYWGGHMFIPGDALANADVMVTSGGTTLKTKCATGGYTDFRTMALQDTWTGGGIVAAATSMFLGKITYGPGYQQAITAGTDATGNGYVVIEVLDNRVFVGYVSGASAGFSANPTTNVGNGLKTVYVGDIERPGGMFFPAIYIGNPSPSSAVNIQPVLVTIGEELLYRPTLSPTDAFPALNPDKAAPYSGDNGHPSQTVCGLVFDAVMAAQDFTTPLPSVTGGAGEVNRDAVAANDTTATAAIVPVDAVLSAILIENTTANAVTGGIDIGTTAGASDVVSALTVGANGLIVAEGATLLNKWFSTTVTQKLYVTAHTAWNSASLNVRFVLRR